MRAPSALRRPFRLTWPVPFRLLGRVLAGLALIWVAVGAVWVLDSADVRESPETLFSEIARLNREGEHHAVWALTAPEGRARFERSIDNLRRPAGLDRGCGPRIANPRVTRQELVSLSYEELFVRESAGLEHLTEGARITRRRSVPGEPADVALHWANCFGDRFVTTVRRTEDGWGLLGGVPELVAATE